MFDSQAQADSHDHDCPGQRQGERGNERRPDAFAKQKARAERDEDGREVGEQRRVRDRGQLDRPVPEGEVPGEEQPGHGELEVFF